MSEIDPIIYILLLIAIGFFMILFLIRLVVKLNEFSRELEYINMEIRRASSERRKYWKRKKRRLWLSLLPFFPE